MKSSAGFIAAAALAIATQAGHASRDPSPQPTPKPRTFDVYPVQIKDIGPCVGDDWKSLFRSVFEDARDKNELKVDVITPTNIALRARSWTEQKPEHVLLTCTGPVSSEFIRSVTAPQIQ